MLLSKNLFMPLNPPPPHSEAPRATMPPKREKSTGTAGSKGKGECLNTMQMQEHLSLEGLHQRNTINIMVNLLLLPVQARRFVPLHLRKSLVGENVFLLTYLTGLKCS